MQRAISLFFILLLAHGILGCSDDPLSADEQLRSTIREAESYIQARDLSATLEFVHADYRDNNGFDLRQLRAMLAGYFLRHKSIHILTTIDNIEVHENGHAKVLIYAGLAGSPQDRETSLSQWRGDLLRLDLTFLQQDEEWLLSEADWRRATPQDFMH
ncbi:MAG: hypothetical protein MI756_07660 [Chromatiales bacterium]|nr:hypothetical protein [Chromatiales bacterium]